MVSFRNNLWDSDKRVTLIFLKQVPSSVLSVVVHCGCSIRDGEMVQVYDPSDGNMTPCTESLR